MKSERLTSPGAGGFPGFLPALPLPRCPQHLQTCNKGQSSTRSQCLCPTVRSGRLSPRETEAPSLPPLGGAPAHGLRRHPRRGLGLACGRGRGRRGEAGAGSPGNPPPPPPRSPHWLQCPPPPFPPPPTRRSLSRPPLPSLPPSPSQIWAPSAAAASAFRAPGPAMVTPGPVTQATSQEPDRFYYDYDSVRIVGLTLATIMFVLGILIILSKKVKCRKSDSSPTIKNSPGGAV
ncbi:uncharacterized protein LOC110202082 [Phascolarctos cinereus]